jgi:hypothetical protein
MKTGALSFAANPVIAMMAARGRSEDGSRCRAGTPHPRTGSSKKHEQPVSDPTAGPAKS